MREVTGAKVVTIAVKRKNEDVVDGFQKEAEAEGFKTLVYEDVYPAGDEYILVYEITGPADSARRHPAGRRRRRR